VDGALRSDRRAHPRPGAQWAATTSTAAGEAFNITNGDYFRWCNIWPKFAAMFAVPDAEPRHISLTEFMADKAPVWDRIVAKHNLPPYPYAACSWVGCFAGWLGIIGMYALGLH